MPRRGVRVTNIVNQKTAGGLSAAMSRLGRIQEKTAALEGRANPRSTSRISQSGWMRES